MKKIAWLGCAHIHTPHFTAMVKDEPAVQVAGVWDHDAARASATAEKLGAPVISDLSSVWNDTSIEAVVICSETNRHAELIIPAAHAGKDIYAEKPIGCHAEDARQMSAAVAQSGVRFHTGYFRRGQAIDIFLKKLIAEGTLGKITRVRYNNCHSGSLGGWFDTDWRWMADPAQAGCGAFGDLGTHVLDIVMWWLGQPERVTADIEVVTGRYGDCDETGEALLRFPSGTLATLSAAWVDCACPVTLTVSGTEGHATVINDQLYLACEKLGADGSKPWTDLPHDEPAGFELFLDYLAGRQSADRLVTVQEAAARNIVMDALYQAAATHTWVDTAN